jgi:hypothetical protein
MQIRATIHENDNGEDFGKCGCGRSPDGKCCGWHGLTEQEYQLALATYIAEKQGE